MPNLNQLYSLREMYSELSPLQMKQKDYLQKAFISEMLTDAQRESRKISFLTEGLNVNSARPSLIDYFEKSPTETVILLYIDICSFSKRIMNLDSKKVKTYLDDYYSKVIPIIYNWGGEIEKLMGDGIICVFGMPFLKKGFVRKAEGCAEEIIRKLYNTSQNVKIAIHKGEVIYYKVPSTQYGEYTMIGQTLTELYRLESVSEPNAINFYSNSLYDNLGWGVSSFDESTILCNEFRNDKLQGVDYTHIKYIKFPDLTK